MKRWINKPEGSNWGVYGENDQVGRINLITQERRLKAIKEVEKGLIFSLSMPLDYPGGDLHPPFRHPPKLSSTLGEHNLDIAKVYGSMSVPDIANDDRVTLCTQYSTQWDALCHIGCQFDSTDEGKTSAVYYNGYKANIDVVTSDIDGNSNAKALGINKLAEVGVQGRAILVNFHKIYGQKKVLIGYDELTEALESQNVSVQQGDILCIYTGFADMVMSMNKNPDSQLLRGSFCDLNGYDKRLLQWITDSGISAICSDNQAVECHPDTYSSFNLVPHVESDNRVFFPLHQHCLFKLGIHLGELWYFKDLAEWLDVNNRSSFLLTAPPLNLPGAVGSPVTPIATV
ncbi:cyclase family protein [Vibrio mediterranei]|uniref:cyclase family protein n=1 Tax=Vibrio mediterranei TaxID=689 RepID=UPI001EFE984E|nr:cyclase family protein [Vibrio mediterranei]MCG9629108.1 cyclase family protein [Vibrio mediterranei]